MSYINIRNVKIGEGIPKICVPIVGETREDILKSAKRVETSGGDLVEWRVDWYESVFCVSCPFLGAGCIGVPFYFPVDPVWI